MKDGDEDGFVMRIVVVIYGDFVNIDILCMIVI